MKTIGLIGGMSWESTLEYYRIINEAVKEKLGGSHSAKCLIYSFDFAEIEKLQHIGDWNRLAALMIDAARRLEKCGAELIIICTNTMHKVAGQVQSNINIPLIHIVDAVGEKIVEKKIGTVGLLGTRFTMEDPFYKDRLEEKFKIKVLIPNFEERKIIHEIIYEELVQGILRKSSKEKFKEIIENLKEKGIEGVILGCTEIPLLIKQSDIDIPVFDTTRIHALKAVELALKESSL
ncbi:MAG: aspartate racemase [Candidatus Methanomethylicota archaeon]|nr:MAG: aspartate racemase [Candidatus Verstraetearchaeota archaeon]